MSAMGSSDVIRLLRRPGFARYFGVVAAARATGSMFIVAVVLLVYQRTGSLTLGGLVVAATTLPCALSGPFLGAWLDVTRSRRRLLVLDRLLTAISLVAFVLAAGHAPNWTLLLIGLVCGITSPLSAGGFASVIPEVAGQELLDVAMTFEATSINLATVAGPALAGVIAGAFGPAAAVEVQVGVGLVLAALIASDPTFELRPARTHDEPTGVMHAVRGGLRALWAIRGLRFTVLAGVVYASAWGTLTIGFPAYALSVGSPAHAAGYMWAAISIGSAASAFAFRSPARALPSRVLIPGCFLAMAVSIAAWPLAGTLVPALLLIALTGALEGPSLPALFGLRQRLAPAHLRSQILTTVGSLAIASTALGAAVTGPLQSAGGTDAALGAFAGLIVAAAAIAVFADERRGAAVPAVPA
jgi:predicted MFS family arabinose efflux permease